jgi:hypothetical protein
LIGSVVRVNAQKSGAALVIELLFVPPDFEDLVQDQLLCALERAQLPWSSLVDSARRRRELVAVAFRGTSDLALQIDNFVGVREQLGGLA